MAQQEEIVLWIDQRWKRAIEKHLKGETLQEHLENVLDDLDSSLSYSVDGYQMTHTEREYGEQFTFIRK